MFSFVGLVIRNPSMVTRHARRLYATHKAMRAFHKTHKLCAWCGATKRLEVHHIIPVSVAPAKAADTTNMIVLCRSCHLVVGHNNSFRNSYVIGVVRLCSTYRKVMRIGAAK